MEQKKGGENPYRITPPHAVGDVLRSGVAPLRCSVSYTAANLGKVLETTKTFPKKFAKKGKVSHEVGQKKGKSPDFPPRIRNNHYSTIPHDAKRETKFV